VNPRLNLSLLTLVLVLLSLMVNGAPAQGQCYSHWAKQLTVDTGWMANCDHVFLTSEGGRAWRDITPPQLPAISSPLHGISAVFFLDGSTAWVVMNSYYEEEVAKEGSYNSPTHRFFLASTNDAGVHWSYRRVSTPEIDHAGLEGSYGLSENAFIYFTDAQHGIMNVQVAAGSAVRPTALSVITLDGGKTWKDVEGSGVPGDFLFTTQSDGWMGSGSEDDPLHVTHDGGRTWQEVTLPRPAKAAPEQTNAIYHLPIFPDKRHGFLSVEYEGANLHLVGLFSTIDGGRRWKSDPVVPLSLGTAIHPVFTVLDSKWKALSVAGHNLVVVSPLAPSRSLSAQIDASLAWLNNATFLDGLHGWAWVGGDGPLQLLSTSDGGASWTIITPPPIKGNVVGNAPRVRTSPAIWRGDTSSSSAHASPSGVSSAVSMHLAFDRQYVMDVPSMQTWWNTSQFWDTNVYLPGAANMGKADKKLNAAWVAAIQGQGWGIIPTWVGAQPSTACSGGTGTPGNCKKYYNTQISPDTATAYAQGGDEASAAMAAAELLNICCAVIYKDIENYVTATDGAAVEAFLSGWVTTLQVAGYQTGVYGNSSSTPNSGPAVLNFSKVTPAIGNAWIAWSNKQASTWGLFPPLGGFNDGNLWPTHQRIHQYWIDHKETHGGVTPSAPATIDSNIEDATILGNSGVKPYSWTWTIVASPYSDPSGNSYLTFTGINDSGQLVGDYELSTSPQSGLLYVGGTMKTIDDPAVSNPVSYLYGINGLGDIAGTTWNFSTGAGPYWTYHKGKFTAITTPAGYQGFSFVLNDAGQMAGCAYNPTAQLTYGFFYEAGNYSFLSYGANSTCVGGINGQGQMVGEYQTSDGNYHGFVYSLADGWTTLDYPGAINTYLLGVNSNGGILGEALTPALVFFLYSSGQFTNLSLPYFNDNDIAQNLNDYADIVGYGETFVPQQYAVVEGVYGQTQH